MFFDPIQKKGKSSRFEPNITMISFPRGTAPPFVGHPRKKESRVKSRQAYGCERFGASKSLRIREGFGGLCARHRYSTCQGEHDVCCAGIVCILILYFCVCAHVCQHLRLRSRISTSELEPVSPLNRAKSGKIGLFQTFEVWTFVPAIFWFLVVCMVKMWSDRKKKYQKRFLVPIFISITYVGTSIVSSAAVGICARNRPKHLKASWVYFGCKNHKSKHSYPSVMVISIEPGSLLVVLKMSVRSLSLWRNRF